MHWFGPGPFAPACEPELRVPIPTGTTCAYCDEPIADADKGFLIPRVGGEGTRLVVNHAECFQVGVVGHVHCVLSHGSEGVCPPNVERDPAGMTRRQAARLAVYLSEARRAGRLGGGARSILLDRFFPSQVRRN